ncbi:aldose epimerase family protein [Cellulomonas sp. P5_E12]
MPRSIATPPPSEPPRSATGAVSLVRSSTGTRMTAQIDLLGGGLRTLVADDVPLVETYADGAAAPFAAGAVLFPWPNRVRGGRWVHRGAEQQLFIDDVEHGNANHGLVRDKRFTVIDQGADHVTIRGSVADEPGYPFSVALQITYRLTDGGITVDSLVSNGSAEPAPVALGAHPYVRIGEVPVEDLMLRVPADAYLPVDERLIPGAPVGVDGTALDWRTARRIGDAELNTCFALTEGAGRTPRTVAVAAPDGRVLDVWLDHDFGYAQIYTCPAYPDPSATRRALAVEPMSAPGDALNSGTGLRWLAPGDEWRLAWGITATWLPTSIVAGEPGSRPAFF